MCRLLTLPIQREPRPWQRRNSQRRWATTREIWDAYDENFQRAIFDKRQAVYVDYNYARVEFYGKGIKGDGDDMTAGKIASIGFVHWQTGTLLSITDLNLKASKLGHVLIDDGIEALMTFVLKGNDTIRGGKADDILSGGAGSDRIFGSAGDDHILGQRGNDKLTGGAGRDHFYLETGGGKDVVTDFQATGDAHDWVHLRYGVTYDIIDDRKGAIVRLGSNDTMQLLGVDAGDVKIWQEYVDPGQF
jgi:Ca2+-binding RTX toxin-like protein